MNRATLFTAILLSAAGCGGGGAASSEESYEGTTDTTGGTTDTSDTMGGGTEETAETPPEPAGPNPVEVCTTMRTRERECADAFLPALVDLRIRIDNPAGTARSGRNARGRTRLLATARTEFETDSTDERIAATCTEFGGMPSDVQGPMVTGMQACIAAADCAAFVECDMPLTERRLTAGAAAPAEAPAE